MNVPCLINQVTIKIRRQKASRMPEIEGKTGNQTDPYFVKEVKDEHKEGTADYR